MCLRSRWHSRSVSATGMEELRGNVVWKLYGNHTRWAHRTPDKAERGFRAAGFRFDGRLDSGSGASNFTSPSGTPSQEKNVIFAWEPVARRYPIISWTETSASVPLSSLEILG